MSVIPIYFCIFATDMLLTTSTNYKMKQNIKKSLFLIFALVCAFSVNARSESLTATSDDGTFTALIPLGNDSVEATFTIIDEDNKEVMIGYDNTYYEADIVAPTLPGINSSIVEGKYFTAIDKSSEGRLYIPATVTDPDGNTYTVTAIANHAFAECAGLTFISIPNTVNDIDTYAFNQCTGLKALKVDFSTPLEVLSSTFTGDYEALLLVPRGSSESFAAAKYWKDFADIIEYPNGDVNMDGVVNIQDVVATVSYLLGTPTEPFEITFADMNVDGTVNITDVIAIVGVILDQE